MLSIFYIQGFPPKKTLNLWAQVHVILSPLAAASTAERIRE